jgi:hypothetical protein
VALEEDVYLAFETNNKSSNPLRADLSSVEAKEGRSDLVEVTNGNLMSLFVSFGYCACQDFWFLAAAAGASTLELDTPQSLVLRLLNFITIMLQIGTAMPV